MTRKPVMPDPLFVDPALPPRTCDHAGCRSTGEFRAPRSPRQPGEWYWFCLDHVRVYNAGWNYYAGMSEAEIDQELRGDTTWHRPTWPLGRRMGGTWWRLADRFGLFEEAAEQTDERRVPIAETPESRALTVMELAPPVTIEIIKTRYKELVKRHHPDANGGSKQAEERLKVINAAYSTLMAATN
ncbi:MAG: J domain-containing protein [Alphaproteobacteria bacterium]|nr:J domain-containing protein [Alphaproteobacteria bacterium]